MPTNSKWVSRKRVSRKNRNPKSFQRLVLWRRSTMQMTYSFSTKLVSCLMSRPRASRKANSIWMKKRKKQFKIWERPQGYMIKRNRLRERSKEIFRFSMMLSSTCTIDIDRRLKKISTLRIWIWMDRDLIIIGLAINFSLLGNGVNWNRRWRKLWIS